MVDKSEDATPFVPNTQNLTRLKKAALSCKGCGLYLRATQSVFGEGAKHADLMFVGEQPGNEEDLQGKPFVGPAGKLLDKFLAQAGLDRSSIYLTNAVKHFSWVPRGKRRLHSKPRAGEIRACHPWLEAEIASIQPRIIVCLGATAAQSILGKTFRLTQHRGELLRSPHGQWVMATIHPSAILRTPDEKRQAEKALFLADLIKLKQHLQNL
jgi:uracil-DNA glycosylase